MPPLYKLKNLPENDLIGKQLHLARLKQKLKISTIADKLNINKKYLIALEKNEFYKLPPGIYAKNFLREYAQFLNLNSEKLLKQITKTNQEVKNNTEKIFIKKASQSLNSLALYKFIKISFIIIIIFICLAYLGYCLNNIISPPYLIINNPLHDITTTKNNINIIGKTETEAQVTINSELILPNKQGNFAKIIELKKGLNIITIISKKRYSRPNTIIKKIFVNQSK